MNHFVLLLSAICQWFTMGTYLHDALHTSSGTLCRLKCGAAAVLYASIGFVLTWMLSHMF